LAEKVRETIERAKKLKEEIEREERLIEVKRSELRDFQEKRKRLIKRATRHWKAAREYLRRGWTRKAREEFRKWGRILARIRTEILPAIRDIRGDLIKEGRELAEKKKVEIWCDFEHIKSWRYIGKNPRLFEGHFESSCLLEEVERAVSIGNLLLGDKFDEYMKMTDLGSMFLRHLERIDRGFDIIRIYEKKKGEVKEVEIRIEIYDEDYDRKVVDERYYVEPYWWRAK